MIFTSFFRRVRPEQVGNPAVLVSYSFTGFLDEIYASLVVRLHHTKPFKWNGLWRHAADFNTFLCKQLGVKLRLTPNMKTQKACSVGCSEKRRATRRNSGGA